MDKRGDAFIPVLLKETHHKIIIKVPIFNVCACVICITKRSE